MFIYLRTNLTRAWLTHIVYTVCLCVLVHYRYFLCPVLSAEQCSLTVSKLFFSSGRGIVYPFTDGVGIFHRRLLVLKCVTTHYHIWWHRALVLRRIMNRLCRYSQKISIATKWCVKFYFRKCAAETTIGCHCIDQCQFTYTYIQSSCSCIWCLEC